MISIQRLCAQGKNKKGDNVVDYLMATEYYVDKDGSQRELMRWGGKASVELGLTGKAVVKDDMLALAKGFAPDDGRALCQNAGALPTTKPKVSRISGEAVFDENGQPVMVTEGGHRVGFDLTFTPPKPVSVGFAMAQGEQRDHIMEAHRRSVARAMDWLETRVETRRGHAGKDVIGVSGLVYSQHDHLANRDLEPNIHTHTLVYGVAKGEDGNWGTFDPVEIYRHRRTADALYQSELARELQQLGYGITHQREVDANNEATGRMIWGIEGVSKEMCDRFSSRRQQILDYQAEHGVDAQTACLATRRHKDEPSFQEMQQAWTQTMALMKEHDPTLIIDARDLLGREGRIEAPINDQALLERLHKSEAVFSREHLITALAHEHLGQMDLAQLNTEADAFIERNALSRINPEGIATVDRGNSLAKRHTEERFAAPWMVQWEREIVHRVSARQDEQDVRLPEAVVEKAMVSYERAKGFTLSDEQRHAIRHLTTETGGVGVLSGLAGTGKTTVSEVYGSAFEAQSKTLLGVAVSNAAAKKLHEESGMPTLSVAKALDEMDKENLILTKNHVVVLDEAGMVDSQQARRLLVHCHKAGAKLIMQGDQMQLQPVGAGAPFALAKGAVGDAKLTEIRRQADPQDRHIAALFYDRDAQGQVVDPQKDGKGRRATEEKGAEILLALHQRGSIDAYTTSVEATKALVHDYLASPTPAEDKLALGHSRAEVAGLNTAIRKGLQDRGELHSNQAVITAKDGGQWHEMELAIGDRLRFTARDEDLGVINGSRGILRKIIPSRAGGYDLTVELPEEKRTVSFNNHEFRALAHDYATTVHKAQGQGKRDIFHLVNPGMIDNQSGLVAFTRLTKGRYTMYGAADDIETLGGRLGLERLKANAIQEGVREPALVQAINKLFENQSSPMDPPEQTRKRAAERAR